MTLFDLTEPDPERPGAEREAPEPTSEAAQHGPLPRVAEVTRRVILGIAYDGTGFHGFARQPGVRTVGGAVAEVLEKMSGVPVEITCAGRTDTGVHATGQVVHADLPAEWLATQPRRRRKRSAGADASAGADDGSEFGQLGWLAQALTAQLGPEVAVWGAWESPEGFDARHSATSRRYRYSVLNVAAPNPLLALSTWHVPARLDLKAMRTASDAVLGEHDFAAFCRRPPDNPCGPIRRRVIDVRWAAAAEPTGLLQFEIEANAFCHQMVRSLVGAFVAVGGGSMHAADVAARLRSGERSGTPQPAPPHGLCLTDVRYPPEFSILETRG